MKSWYQSKAVWLGILTTAAAILGLVAQQLTKSDFQTPAEITLLASGIVGIILRIWFTDAPIQK